MDICSQPSVKPAERILRRVCLVLALGGALLAVQPSRVFAIQPPRPGEIERLRANGTLAQSLAFANKLGNHRMNPALLQQKIARMRGTASVQSMSPPGSPALPSLGSPKVLVLLVDFPDYAHTVDASVINEMLFGGG